MPSDDGPLWVCQDCPEDSALVGFRTKSVADQHAERTGHTVVLEE